MAKFVSYAQNGYRSTLTCSLKFGAEAGFPAEVKDGLSGDVHSSADSGFCSEVIRKVSGSMVLRVTKNSGSFAVRRHRRFRPEGH